MLVTLHDLEEARDVLLEMHRQRTLSNGSLKLTPRIYVAKAGELGKNGALRIVHHKPTFENNMSNRAMATMRIMLLKGLKLLLGLGEELDEDRSNEMWSNLQYVMSEEFLVIQKSYLATIYKCHWSVEYMRRCLNYVRESGPRKRGIPWVLGRSLKNAVDLALECKQDMPAANNDPVFNREELHDNLPESNPDMASADLAFHGYEHPTTNEILEIENGTRAGEAGLRSENQHDEDVDSVNGGVEEVVDDDGRKVDASDPTSQLPTESGYGNSGSRESNPVIAPQVTENSPRAVTIATPVHGVRDSSPETVHEQSPPQPEDMVSHSPVRKVEPNSPSQTEPSPSIPSGQALPDEQKDLDPVFEESSSMEQTGNHIDPASRGSEKSLAHGAEGENVNVMNDSQPNDLADNDNPVELTQTIASDLPIDGRGQEKLGYVMNESVSPEQNHREEDTLMAIHASEEEPSWGEQELNALKTVVESMSGGVDWKKVAFSLLHIHGYNRTFRSCHKRYKNMDSEIMPAKKPRFKELWSERETQAFVDLLRGYCEIPEWEQFAKRFAQKGFDRAYTACRSFYYRWSLRYRLDGCSGFAAIVAAAAQECDGFPNVENEKPEDGRVGVDDNTQAQGEEVGNTANRAQVVITTDTKSDTIGESGLVDEDDIAIVSRLLSDLNLHDDRSSKVGIEDGRNLCAQVQEREKKMVDIEDDSNLGAHVQEHDTKKLEIEDGRNLGSEVQKREKKKLELEDCQSQGAQVQGHDKKNQADSASSSSEPSDMEYQKQKLGDFHIMDVDGDRMNEPISPTGIAIADSSDGVGRQKTKRPRRSSILPWCEAENSLLIYLCARGKRSGGVQDWEMIAEEMSGVGYSRYPEEYREYAEAEPMASEIGFVSGERKAHGSKSEEETKSEFRMDRFYDDLPMRNNSPDSDLDDSDIVGAAELAVIAEIC